jgi:hypothetical protein
MLHHVDVMVMSPQDRVVHVTPPAPEERSEEFFTKVGEVWGPGAEFSFFGGVSESRSPCLLPPAPAAKCTRAPRGPAMAGGWVGRAGHSLAGTCLGALGSGWGRLPVCCRGSAQGQPWMAAAAAQPRLRCKFLWWDNASDGTGQCWTWANSERDCQKSLSTR